MQKGKNNTNIQDFGEKIGGARKDLSGQREITKTNNKEVVHNYTVESTDNGYVVNFKGKILKDGFKTQNEAKEYILDFKENIKSNLAFVKEYNNSDTERYLIYIRNPRTLKSQYAGKEFANKQDAEEYAMALSIYLKEYGKNLYRPEIQSVKRINPNNENITKATGENILNDFGFKGGEFGNWVKQDERQQFLNYAQDAFTDLATALDITPDSLGQNGAMSIAFGSRGQGLTGAVAHFEPVKKVINMTRLKGAGSLAHEYGHSIDNYLSRVSGYDEDGMITTNLRNSKLSDNMKNAINNVIDSMKYNVSTNQAEIDKKNSIYEKNRLESLNYHLKYLDKVFNGEATKYKYNRKIKQYEQVKVSATIEQQKEYKQIKKILEDGKLNGEISYKTNSYGFKESDKIYPEAIEKLKTLYKDVMGRKIDEETIYWLYRHGKPAQQVKEVKSESAYSKSALELDRATGRSTAYFSKIEEMWARAFEAYVSDKLKAKGITNTYLVHSVNNSDYALFNPFPAGEERVNINKAFDNLIQVMKDERLYEPRSRNKQEINTTPTDSPDIRYLKKRKTNSNILESYDEITSNRIKMNTRNVVIETSNQLNNLIDEALTTNENKSLHLGKLNAEIVSKIKNNIKNLPQSKLNFLNKDTYDLVINQSEIRHLIDDKSTLSNNDIKHFIKVLPEIIANSDYVSYTNNLKDEGLRFKKLMEDGTYVSFVIVSNKQGTMKVKTIYMEKGDYENKKRSISPSNNANEIALDNTSETNGAFASTTSIPQNPENVNTSKKTSKVEDGLTNAERLDAYIEQEIKKVEATGKWDNSIPVTRRTDIRKTIEDYLGIGIQKGHFRQRAYGIYNTKTDSIRTKELKDMDSILHEVGHALDLGNRLEIDKESIADELLKAINKYGGYEGNPRSVLLDEGWAEVIREYAIIPEQAKAEYPQSVAVLEELRKADKDFDNFIGKVQEQIYNYIHQNPQNRVLSNMSIGEQTDKKEITPKTIKENIVKLVWDKDYALKATVEEFAKANGRAPTPSENAYLLARLASGVQTKAISMISDGYINEKGETMIPGLSKLGDILGNNPERFNDLRSFLVAQRDLDYKAKTLKTGIRTMDSQAVIKQFEKDTQIQRAAKIVHNTLDGVLTYAVDNGLITRVDADQIRQSNAFYVPMQRVLENRNNQVGRRGAVSDIIKSRTGSELDIKDVLENIVVNSTNIIQQVENNSVLRALYKQGDEAGMKNNVFEKIPAPMQKVGTAQLSTWEKELQKQGIDTNKIDFEKTIDIFAPNNKIDTKNRITSFIDEKGNRVYLQFSDEVLFNTIMNLDKNTNSMFLKIMRNMNMPLKYGATMANVGFALPNMISDTVQAAIFSEAGFIPVVDNALGVLDILTASNKTVANFMKQVAPEYANRINRMYTLYEQSGASSSTRLSQYRKSSQELMRDVYGTKNSETLGIKESFKPLKRLLDIMTYIPEISEQSTRFKVFEKNYEAYRKKGGTELDARIKAAIESRDATQDFGRTGTLMKEVNQLIPFSAARVGSAYTFVEKVKANPKRTVARIAVLTAVAMAIKAIGYDDKEIEELNQRKKDDNFVFKIGDSIITIKKPQGILRSIVNLAEYIQDLATGHIEEGKEGERLGEWINNAIMDNMPADSITGLVPNAFAPLIENAINKDFYYNTDIVKSYDLDLPDSEQYYDYNSQLAILLGQIFNYSPAKIDNLISGYFGGLGTQVTDTIDWISGKLGLSAEEPAMGAEENAIGKRFVVNVNTNSASIDEIYDRKTELTKKKNGGTITDEETEELEKITEAISNISSLNKQIKEIKQSLTISAEQKAVQIKDLQKQKTDTARQALGKDLIYSDTADKIESTKFYPSRDTLSSNGYSLTLTSSMKKEYEKLAYEKYKQYEKQGLYSEEYLEKLETQAKDYAKQTLIKKYKSKLVKTK